MIEVLAPFTYPPQSPGVVPYLQYTGPPNGTCLTAKDPLPWSVHGPWREQGGGHLVPLDDKLVEVGGLGGVQLLKSEVIDQQQVGADQPSHLGVVGAVQTGGLAERVRPGQGPYESNWTLQVPKKGSGGDAVFVDKASEEVSSPDVVHSFKLVLR
jgi:hypothetical protein